MKAFKKILAVFTALIILTGIVPTFSAGAADGSQQTGQSQDNGAPGEVYEDNWVYSGDSGEKLDLAAVGAGSSSDKEIEISLKAVWRSDNRTVDIPGATVCLYVGSELKRKVVAEPDSSVVKMPIGDLSRQDIFKATVSAYKKVSEGKAMDGTARDDVYEPFRNSDGDIIRYEYELHSETIDDGGNWVGESIANNTKADIVFAIDSTGSMGGEITSVKENVASFADTLISSGLDIRFSIIEYRDITNGETTTIHTLKGSKWMTSLSDVTSTLSKIHASGGGDWAETPFDALGAVASPGMNWRSGAERFAFLITDADYKNNNSYGYSGINDLAQALKNQKICTSVITDSDYKSTYSPLYTNTNGIYANINNSFKTNMQVLAENILSVSKRKIELKLEEPRIKYNLTACYLANDDESRSADYKSKLRNTLSKYADFITKTTDGHAFINKIYLFSTENRMDFYDTSNTACMADIQIQTTRHDDGTSGNNVNIHSNAHVEGFYYTSTVSGDGRINNNFKNLDDADSYKGKDIFRSIQMSAEPYGTSTKAFDDDPANYAETLTHESGHYIFGFRDEYGYESEDGTKIVKWDTGGISRPGGREFGLMDHQHDDIELSKLSIDYAGLECLIHKTRTNSPRHYWRKDGSCEDTFADLITYGLSDIESYDLGEYKASYDFVTAGHDRHASYPWFGVKFVNEHGTVAATGAYGSDAVATAGIFDSMTASSEQISDAEYSVSGNTLTISLTEQSGKTYAAYCMAKGDDSYTALASTRKNGKLSFSYTLSANDTAEIRLVENGAGSRYVTYYADTSPSTNVGYIYEAVDGTTIAYENVDGATNLVHISDSTQKSQSGYTSVNNSTYITAFDPAYIDGGEIYSVASCAGDYDYTTLSWFVYRDGTWTKLDTDLTSEENNNIGARADTSGKGLYVLMAKNAASGTAGAAAGLSYTADKTKDGRIILSFTDNNTDSKFYRVYISEKPITSTDADGVLCRTFDAKDGTSIVLNLEQPNKAYYTAVEIVSETGAKSPIRRLTVIGESADVDGDSIPDSYCDEYLLWGTDDEPKDIAGSDDDGDTLTNLEEYVGGSDPRDPDDPVVTMTVPVESVSVSVDKKTIDIGESFDLTATVAPADATDQIVEWHTEDDSIVSLTASGKTCTVKGLKAGTVDVYAVTDDGGYSAVCTVTVNGTDGITLNKSSLSMLRNETYTLKATVSGTNKTVTWSSSNTSVASVSSKGVVTSYGKLGSAVITAKAADGKTATCTVYVNLATPKITKANVTEYGVKLEWGKVTDAAKYRVFRSQGSEGWSRLGDTTSLSYTDTTAESGTEYTYTVRCISADAKSYTSDYDKAGKSVIFIDAPVFSLSNAADGVKISWNKPAGAEKFRVFYKGRNGWTKLADTADTSFIDKEVSSNRSYTYTVRCLNSAATEYTSDYRAGKSILYVEAPRMTLSNATDGVSLKWNAVSGATGYRVYYKGKNGWVKLTDTPNTSCIDDDVSSGKTYTYTVRALGPGGQLVSGYYTDGFKITYIKAPVFSLSTVSNGINISWDKPAGAERFRIYYKGRNGWKKLAETTGSSFVDEDVSYDHTYTYTVRCINSSGTEFTSDYRAGKSIYYAKTPNPTVKNAPDGVAVEWNAVSGVYMYRVFYKSRNGWSKLLDTPKTSCIDTDVSSGKTYTYTVRAVDQNGQYISYYNTSGCKLTYISAPEFNVANVSGGIKITWNKPAGAEKFRVFYRGSKGWMKLTDTTGTSVIDKDVNLNNTYMYTVRCINSNGTEYTSDYRPGQSVRYTNGQSQTNPQPPRPNP